MQVLPESMQVPVGGIAQFAATPEDSAGRPLSGQPIAWHSGDTTIAVSYGGGLFAGIDSGTTTIIATSGGKRGMAPLAVYPLPISESWPHEPPGLTQVSDQPFNLLTALGWFLEFGTASIGIDSTAPLSPPLVLQVTYPPGFGGGSAPGTATRSLPGLRQLYVGIWWKPSNPWQGQNANVNKIQYVFTNSSGSVFMAMYGPPQGPYELRVFPQFKTSSDVWLVPNVNHVAVELGQWHRVEWLLVYNTTTSPANGICRWWLDGQLIGDYRDVAFPADPLQYYKIAPVWGGVGDVKSELDHFWYDHVHLSGQ